MVWPWARLFARLARTLRSKTTLRSKKAWEDTMKIQRAIAPIVGSVLALLAGAAQAAEIKVLASTAVETTLGELGPQFEKATGNKVDITFGPGSSLNDKINQGAAFDVTILAASVT